MKLGLVERVVVLTKDSVFIARNTSSSRLSDEQNSTFNAHSPAF